ncbi:MAG: hypothetical protein JNL85_15860 [Rubrivivax sp.]|nr:hypothetical protein [Rubrivivax sp.]
MKVRFPALAPLAALVLLALGSCGGGGGDGGDPAAEQLGVFTGFADTGNLNWESTGGDGSGGVGDGGASGDGGVGAGGDFGQFRNANVCVYLDDGTQLGCALTDAVKGMVTIKPGRAYRGGLRIELSGTPTATYYEEGRDTEVPFPADRKIRVWVPQIDRNIGITPFTEAAWRLLTEGSAPESVGSGIAPTSRSTLTKTQVRAANERVRQALNEHFPTALQVDDIARLPFIKSRDLRAGSMRTDPRGRYGLVNGAFSKQASFHNGDSATPTLDAVRQLAEDLLDGRIDGRNGDLPAGSASSRTYDPNTLTSELTSALAEQAARFGAQEALDVLPRVVNYGNVRYEGYLFDGSISQAGRAFSTVSGWVSENRNGWSAGQQFDRLPAGEQRALALYANNAHGGGFYKADALGPRHKVYAIGDNVNGELGTGSRRSTAGAAVEITLPGALTHAAGGFSHTVMRMADGAVYTLGDNTFGQLGQGQGPAALAGTTTPLRVALPRAALAVAATNMASYALLDDGSVWSWGSNGGFGLLGNGARDGVQETPAAVPGLTQVVQISARDNDAVVLKRDGSVWHWGSFPADEAAFDAGDPSSAYRGGSPGPVQVRGLPPGAAVRKVITEQGVFAVLLANGQVFQWGVYFDITAGAVLRDLEAGRVLGLPPVRDLMPGGFVGYGTRPFDRLTAMGVDYRGGMWKIRGRVAESFDPQNPAAQHRPQNQGPRLDCHSCHTFLDQALVDLRTAAPPVPAGAAACVIPISAHRSDTGSLVHAETDCALCHNAARLNYPVLTPSGRLPFADSGGWVNCTAPADLPGRSFIAPSPATNSCTVPPRHVFTPPGTVCATCHNSVIARPLNDASISCAQPQAAELPTLATTASITGVVDDAGATLASGALTNDRTPELRGTLSAPLGPNQQLAVTRGSTVLGAATVSGTTWRFLDSTGDGTLRYTARVVNGNAFGATSNAFTLVVDGTPPTATAAVGDFADDALGAIAIGGFATDTTPRINGTLAGALAADEAVQVLRNGTVAGTATVSGGGTWSFTEPAPLTLGLHTYRARVADAAGNLGSTSAAATLTLLAGVPGATIAQAVNASNAVIANGGATNDTRPTFSGSLGSALPAGALVRVLRDGAARGTATLGAGGLTWTFQEPGASDGSYAYTARVEAGAVLGSPSAAYRVTVDTIAPTQRADVATVADDVNGVLVGANPTTADTTPTIGGTLTAPLGAGERLQILRNSSVVATLAPFAGTAWTYTEPTPVPITPPATQVALTYAARVVDEAGQTGPATGSTRQVTVAPGSVPIVDAGTTIGFVAGIAVPAGGATIGSVYTTTPAVSGTIARALAADEQLVIYRNTTSPVVAPSRGGTAVVAGTISAATLGALKDWAFTSGALPASATYFFSANIEKTANAAVYGAPSATSGVPIATATTGAVSGIFDDANVAVAGNNTADSTPRVAGTLARALASGETLQLRRVLGGSTTTVFVAPTGTSWTYTEPAALAPGSYSYAVRIADATGAPGTQSTASTVNVIAPLPSVVTITGPVPLDNAVFDTTPTVSGTLGAVLPAGASVRLYRPTSLGACTPATFGTGTCPSVNAGGSAGSTLWSVTDANIGTGQRRYVARVENGTAYGNTSGEYRLNVVTAPTATISNATTSVMPNTTVAGASPNGNGIANGGLTNDNSPRVQIQFSGAFGTGVALRVKRNGSTVAVASSGSCGSNCFLVDLPSPFALVNNEGGTLAAGTPSGAGLPSAGWSFTAMAVDAAGNEGAASAGYGFSFGYIDCDFARADATYRAYNANNPHAAWAGLNCSSCHTATSLTAPTPAGTLIRVPAGITVPTAPAPSYWCRRP